MKKPIETLISGIVEIHELPLLESTESVVWLSRTIRGTVSGLPGVSTGDLDVVVVDEFLAPRPGFAQVVEVSNKTGKFDGAARVRICLRVLPEEQAAMQRPVELVIPDPDAVPCVVEIRDRYVDREVLWSDSFTRYSHRLTDPARAGDILTWHWQRYYRFLPWCDVEDLALAFGESAVGLTLSEANRLASRQLYSRAREQGWRKLTLREQARWQLRGQWHRDEDCVAARAKVGTPNGASEATNRASRPMGRLDAYEDLACRFD